MISHGPVAQRLEQATHNRLVGGSNPSRPNVTRITRPHGISIPFLGRAAKGEGEATAFIIFCDAKFLV